MPILTSSPWVDRTDPLAYMRAGAETGLQKRGQDIGLMDAGNRLRLSYDSLAASQENERRRAAQDAAATAATYALRQSQQDAMSQYRQQQIDAQQERLKMTAARTAQAADALKAAHDDTAAFVEDAKKLGAADALAKHPQADKVVVNHVMSLEASKAKQTPDKTYVDFSPEGSPFKLMHVAPDDPILNKVGGTNAAALGTNYAARFNAPVTAPEPLKDNEVVRLTKDGRKAVFDTATKKFIRYVP